jgi:hypothetical protein
MKLPSEIDGNEARAGVDCLVPGHGNLSKGNSLMTLDIPIGSRQDAGIKDFFYSFVEAVEKPL